MTTENKKESQDSLAFAMYRNQLDMMARIIDSSCKMSLMMLEATRKSEQQVITTLSEHIDASTQIQDMIPSTEDLQSAANAVTKAMNEAAVRAIAHAAGKQEEAAADNAGVPAQPNTKYKPSISAAPKKTATKAATKKAKPTASKSTPANN